MFDHSLSMRDCITQTTQQKRAVDGLASARQQTQRNLRGRAEVGHAEELPARIFIFARWSHDGNNVAGCSGGMIQDVARKNPRVTTSDAVGSFAVNANSSQR